jgi:hypothetical protein
MPLKLNAKMLISLLLFPTVAFSQPTQPLNNAAVIQYVNANKNGSGPRDPFAPPTTAQTTEQNVLLTFPVRLLLEAPQSWDTVFVRYSYETKQMAVTVRTSPRFPEPLQELGPNAQSQHAKLTPWNIFYDTEYSTRSAQNAYGAKFDVRHTEMVGVSFGDLEFLRQHYPSTDYRETIFEYAWLVEPEAARILSQNIDLQIVGITKEYTNGKNVFCDLGSSPATFRSPSSLSIETCYLTGRVNAVRIVDRKDGTIIKEWLRSASGWR